MRRQLVIAVPSADGPPLPPRSDRLAGLSFMGCRVVRALTELTLLLSNWV